MQCHSRVSTTTARSVRSNRVPDFRRGTAGVSRNRVSEDLDFTKTKKIVLKPKLLIQGLLQITFKIDNGNRKGVVTG